MVSCSGPTDLILQLTCDLLSLVSAQIDIKIITWPEATDYCSFLSSECNDAHYVFTALYNNSYQTKTHFCLQTNVSKKQKIMHCVQICSMSQIKVVKKLPIVPSPVLKMD